MTNINNWNKNNILKFSIDHTSLEEDLFDFPVLLNITESSGKNNYDCSDFFEELEYPDFTTATFSGANGSQPDPTLWTTSSIQKVYIYNDNIRLTGTTSEFVSSKFLLSGNFNIQIDVTDISNPTTNSWAGMLVVKWLSGTYTNKVSIYKSYTDGRYKFISDYSTNGSAGVVSQANDSTNPSKLNIYRTGSTFYFRFWNGSSWTPLSNYSGTTTDVEVILYKSLWDGYPSSTIDFNNFIINEGTIVWPTTKHPNNKKIALVYPSVQEHWVEEYDNYTTLLIQSIDAPIDSTTFTDRSKYKNSVTSYANAHHSGLQPKFGTSSIYFNGVDSYLQVPYSDLFSISQLSIYTIEFWIYLISSSGMRCILGKNNGAGTGSYSIYVYPTQIVVAFSIDGTGGNGVNRSVITENLLNSWHHFAFVFNSGTLKIFQNGSQIGDDWAIPAFNVGTAPLHIGQLGYPGYNYWINCYLEDLRFTKNLARYTENFIPPEAPSSKEILYKSYLHKENEQLFCEIENWDQANKSIQLWTKVPRVLYNQPTEILLYFDSTQEDNTYYIGATGEGAAQKVWDDNFIAVYHMAQPPVVGSASILDSTKNILHGVPTSLSIANLTTSPTGNSILFNNSAFISLPDYSIFNPTSITLMTYFLADATQPSYSRIIDKSAIPSGKGYCICTTPGGSVFFEGFSTTTHLYTYGANNIVGDSKWHTFTAAHKAGYGRAYTDGILTSTNSNTGDLKNTINAPRIAGGVIENSFNGKIGQIQISSTARSDSWLALSSLTIKDTIMTITKATIYQVSGYITSNNQPAQRQVFLYERTSGELVDKGISTAEGYYSLKTPFSGEHNIVCLDDPYDVDLDDLILSKVIPTEVV